MRGPVAALTPLCFGSHGQPGARSPRHAPEDDGRELEHAGQLRVPLALGLPPVVRLTLHQRERQSEGAAVITTGQARETPLHTKELAVSKHLLQGCSQERGHGSE